MTRPLEAPDKHDINPVWEWFEFQAALVAAERRHILPMLVSGKENAGKAHRAHESRFIGRTRTEVEEFFDAQRDRLELLTMFDILATTEAILRTEFTTRVAARKKDGLSRRFRELSGLYGDKIQLDEHILDAMKDEGVSAAAIGHFRGALKLRNWLAHGRHWPPKLGRVYEPGDVFEIARTLIESVPPA